MLVSVVIPAYNCIDSLENTLNSILRSGLTDYEIVLVDDGSADGTAGLCDALADRHGNVRCIHQDNGGVSVARNRGIREAQGQYILFFDADDTVDAGALARCQELLTARTPDMLVFGMSFDYYFHGKCYRREELVAPVEGLLTRDRWLGEMEALYRSNALSPVWNKFLRRELLTENRVAFPGGMIEMEDFWFSVRCLRYCDRIYVLPEAIYRYRQPEDERNTYRRLCRIPGLGTYMEPFETELAWVPGGGEIAASIYETFFYEMIRFGDPARIQRAAEDLMGGKYARRIESADPELFRMLKNRNYGRIRLRGMAKRLRHAVAVRVKYWRNGGVTG